MGFCRASRTCPPISWRTFGPATSEPTWNVTPGWQARSTTGSSLVCSCGGAFYHWRSAGGAEVDLLLERDGWLHPFQIRLTAHPTKRHAAGLTAFRASYPHLLVAKGAILCATERPFWINDEVAALRWNQV